MPGTRNLVEGSTKQGHYNEDTALVPVPEVYGGGATIAAVVYGAVGVQAP